MITTPLQLADFPDSDLVNDPLKNINLEAMGGAGKVLKMLAEKVSAVKEITNFNKSKAATPTPPPTKSSKTMDESSENKTGVIAKFEKAKRHSACHTLAKRLTNHAVHASNFTDGAASAAFTSTGLMPQKSSKTHMFDEEECSLSGHCDADLKTCLQSSLNL